MKYKDFLDLVDSSLVAVDADNRPIAALPVDGGAVAVTRNGVKFTVTHVGVKVTAQGKNINQWGVTLADGSALSWSGDGARVVFTSPEVKELLGLSKLASGRGGVDGGARRASGDVIKVKMTDAEISDLVKEGAAAAAAAFRSSVEGAAAALRAALAKYSGEGRALGGSAALGRAVDALVAGVEGGVTFRVPRLVRAAIARRDAAAANSASVKEEAKIDKVDFSALSDDAARALLAKLQARFAPASEAPASEAPASEGRGRGRGRGRA